MLDEGCLLSYHSSRNGAAATMILYVCLAAGLIGSRCSAAAIASSHQRQQKYAGTTVAAPALINIATLRSSIHTTVNKIHRGSTHNRLQMSASLLDPDPNVSSSVTASERVPYTYNVQQIHNAYITHIDFTGNLRDNTLTWQDLHTSTSSRGCTRVPLHCVPANKMSPHPQPLRPPPPNPLIHIGLLNSPIPLRCGFSS